MEITKFLDENSGIFYVENFGYVLRFDGTAWCYHVDWGWIYIHPLEPRSEIVTVSPEDESTLDDSGTNTSDDSYGSTDETSGGWSSYIDSNLVLYNLDTEEIITQEEIDAMTTVDSWISLSPDKYADKYKYPAYYNYSAGHYIVQNDGTVINGWVIMDENSGGWSSYIDSNQSNSATVQEGDSYSFTFFTLGDRAYSFKVEGLPSGLTYNDSSTSPTILGTPDTAGSYSIEITGYRWSDLRGESTALYNLNLEVETLENPTSTTDEGYGSTDEGVESNDLNIEDENQQDNAHTVEDSMHVLYNTRTYRAVIPSDIESGKLDMWNRVDENQFPEYDHPAYINFFESTIIDSSDFQNSDWIIKSFSSNHEITGENQQNIEPTVNDSPMVLYNSLTGVIVRPSDIEAGGTSWFPLDENDYPYYEHPAYYNFMEHFVVDSSGTESYNWIITSYANTSMVLYNASTGEIVMPSEIDVGLAGWFRLDEYFYSHLYTPPAYYNIFTNLIVNSTNSSGDWTITEFSSVENNLERRQKHTGIQSIWFYKPNRGWHWTSLGTRGSYPHVYSDDLSSWLYLSKKNGLNVVYSHQINSWQRMADYTGF